MASYEFGGMVFCMPWSFIHFQHVACVLWKSCCAEAGVYVLCPCWLLCRLDEIAYHFSFTYYSMLSGGHGPDGLGQLAALYLDHSVRTTLLQPLRVVVLCVGGLHVGRTLVASLADQGCCMHELVVGWRACAAALRLRYSA